MIGIVGPEDSVALVLRVAAEMGLSQQVLPRSYDQPDQAARLAAELDTVCQVILFTGRVPYSVARQAGYLHAHLDFVPHAGIDLYRSLVLLLRAYAGHLPVLSIDTIEPEIIAEVWRDLALEPPTAVLPLTDGPAGAPVRGSADIAAFHAAAWRAGTVQACVTCFRSVYDALLAEGVTAYRVEHTRASVRDALSRALGLAQRTVAEMQQIAVGLVEIVPRTPLARAAPALIPASSTDARGRLARLLHARVQVVDERTEILFTTWGTLRTVLDQRTIGPDALLHDDLAVGFGLGATLPRAEENARRALTVSRSERVPHVVFADGTLCRLDDLQHGRRFAVRTRDANLLGRAHELGMSGASVQRVFVALQQLDTEAITARDLADALGLGSRSARRILQRLQLHGVIEPSGSDSGPRAGRPRTLYRLYPERLLALGQVDAE